MTFEEFIAFSEDPTNEGKFLVKEIKLPVFNQNEEGKEVQATALLKVVLQAGQIHRELVDLDAIASRKNDIEREKQKIEELEKAMLKPQLSVEEEVIEPVVVEEPISE